MRRHVGRWSGKLGLLVSLAAVLISGCSQVVVKSSYRVNVPILTLEARTFQCGVDRGGQIVLPQECVALLKRDYEAIVRELKAACLANGQTAEECQTN